jgi:hypothetical protein
MTTFAAVATSLEAKAPDATKHVNYSLGMVLGVDDFNQEFAYLAGRDRWLARDAVGYGTLCGLSLKTDTVPSKGPRLTVTSGSALTPRGQLVCVKPNQCAYLNDWLAANKDKIAPLLGSPLAGTIDLYLTLCYRDCPADLVPIPGAPCRAEDELMAPSRLVDDFSLELRLTPPDQSEEDVLRQFVNWLRTLTFGTAGPFMSPEDFETLIRGALKVVAASPSSPPSSPLSSPLSGGAALILLSPLGSMNLDPTLGAEYYRAAFRVWIEELRPNVHAVCACSGGCCGGATDANEPPKADECLLLARINIPVVRSSGNWVVDDLGTIDIDESRRPMLLHLRMLQELLVQSPAALGGAAGPRVVAAGLVGVDASASPTFGGLTVAFQAQNTLRLNFTGYNVARRYIVKALANSSIDNPTVAYDSATNAGILLRVTRGAANIADNALRAAQFMIEISQIG